MLNDIVSDNFEKTRETLQEVSDSFEKTRETLQEVSNIVDAKYKYGATNEIEAEFGLIAHDAYNFLISLRTRSLHLKRKIENLND